MIDFLQQLKLFSALELLKLSQNFKEIPRDF